MLATTTTLALSILLTLAQEEAPPSEPPAPAEVQAPAPCGSRHVVDEARCPSPQRTRYLLAPSAMMLRQGEGQFSQEELLISSLSYGLTDHLTLQVGSVLPAWLLGPLGFNGMAGLKVGGSLTQRLHLATSAHVVYSRGINSGRPVGLVLGTVTYGTPEAQLSLGVGKPLVLDEDDRFFNPHLMTSLSANVRVSKRFALVTENWLVPTWFGRDDDAISKLPMINSLALRILGPEWSVDVGAIRAPGVSFPIPWLDFSYALG
jgi:hypothetical protein